MYQLEKLVYENKITDLTNELTNLQNEFVTIQTNFQEYVDNLLFFHNVILSEKQQQYTQLQKQHQFDNFQISNNLKLIKEQSEKLKIKYKKLTYQNRTSKQIQK